MRIVIQRVQRASVTINEEIKSEIGQGMLILVGIEEADNEQDVDWLVRKTIGLRIFDDENHVMNCDIKSIDGEILVISQFTLFASYKKGNRPSWFRAAKHEHSIPLLYVGKDTINIQNYKEIRLKICEYQKKR